MIKNRFVNELGIHRPEQEERNKQLRAVETLTEREKEILGWVGKGLTSNSIAQQLHISPRTVDTHRARIMQKLGLKNKLDVVRFMMEHTLN
jgi:two-component system response regulator NreC